MKRNPLQSYKRCEDIFLDKYHVILPELQWHKTARVLGLHSQALLGRISVTQQRSSSSSSCQPGHTVWSSSLEKVRGTVAPPRNEKS